MNERTIFLEALEKSNTDERRAFLDEACGDDRELRQKVEQLHYFSMKLIEGGTLAERRPTTADDRRVAAELISTVARAVHVAHQSGILHRDLKPGNILIDGDGQPHITDFGLAKRVEGDSGLTQSGQIMGTPKYMAPEQARGGSRTLTVAADIYSLGAILYEVSVGRPPFEGDSVIETIRLVTDSEPPRPRTQNANVDRDFETIILKCLEKDPSRRFQSAQALADDLDRWLAGEPIVSRPITSVERTLKWARRKPVAAALLVVSTIAVLSLGAVVTGVFFNKRLQESLAETHAAKRETELALQAETEARNQAVLERDKASAARAQAESAAQAEAVARQEADQQRKMAIALQKEAERATQVEQQARQQVELERTKTAEALEQADWYRYLNAIGLAQAEWENNNIARMQQLLDDCPKQHRHWEWHYLKRLAHQDLLTFDKHDAFVRAIAITSDGKLVASASGRTIFIWESPRSASSIRVMPPSLPFSPDSQRLALAFLPGCLSRWKRDACRTDCQSVRLREFGHGLVIHPFSGTRGRIGNPSYRKRKEMCDAGEVFL